MDSRELLVQEIVACIDAQTQTAAEWHTKEPDKSLGRLDGNADDTLLCLVLRQHLMNFTLWHVEDTARRKDVDDSVIADCKRRIDTWNQRRNDAMEEVDACLVARIAPLLPAPTPGLRVRRNTESLGMAMDRLSIMALKIFHMAEQIARSDADAEHRANCAAKLATLEKQRTDLATAVFDLLDDFCTGAKRPHTYYQFKMYNDPALNPEIYVNCSTPVTGECGDVRAFGCPCAEEIKE